MRKSVKIYFTDKQVCSDQIKEGSFSKSPLKPALYVKAIKDRMPSPNDMIEFIDDFKPFRKRDFYNAHTEDYVDHFFAGQHPDCQSNGLPWSKKLAQSVKYTNSSLYNAIEESLLYPNHIYVSPTSGFHHARPNAGGGFCTFSGQVIASVKLYRKYGVRGAYLDLDGHYGNSIPDSKNFIKNKYGWDLNDIIPMNVNPQGSGLRYLNDLEVQLHRLEQNIRGGYIDYVVWCHGADSHEDDDLGNQLNTQQWREASTMFYAWLDKLERDLGRKIPLVLSLFGGYRRDDYQSVINLHLSDLWIGMSVLMNRFMPLDGLEVKPKFINMSNRKRRTYLQNQLCT
jgi:acetoin utilization deacetylase AcuC-like enzyme